MTGNEFFAEGNSVFIRFQEPSGVKTHLFGKMASQGTACYTAEALNLMEEKHQADYPNMYAPPAENCTGRKVFKGN